MFKKFFSTLYSSLLRLYSNFYDSSNVWLQHYWFKYLCFILYNYLMNILFNFINFLIFTWKILSNSVFLFIKYVLAILFILILSISLYFLVKFLDNNFGFSLLDPFCIIFLESNIDKEGSQENSSLEKVAEDSILNDDDDYYDDFQFFNAVGLPVNSYYDMYYDNVHIKFLREFLNFDDNLIREMLIREGTVRAEARRLNSHLIRLEEEDARWWDNLYYIVLAVIFLLTIIIQFILFRLRKQRRRRFLPDE